MTTTTSVNMKVRLVRCPKCRQLLVELPDVTIYKCGGCGTTLLAKNKKVDNNHADLSSQDNNSVAKIPQQNVSQLEDCGNKEQHCEEKSGTEGISSSPMEDAAESLKHESHLGQNSSSEFSSTGEAYNSDAREESKRDEVQKLAGHENEESVSPPGGEKGQGIEGNYGSPENDVSFADQNKLAEENDNISADESMNGTVIDDHQSQSHVSLYLTSDDERLNHSMREGADTFERVSSVDTFASSSMLNYPTTRKYDAYDGSEESSGDGIDELVSRLPRKSKDRATKSSTDKSTETNRYTSGNRMRDPLPGHTSTAGMPSYQHSSLPPRPGSNSSQKTSYSEADNIDLLKTVWELKDQLNRIQLHSNRRFPTGNFPPYHYDHLNTERGYAGRFNESKQAFSGEVGHHCCTQNRPYSAQLSRNIISLSGPQHYTSSELSLRSDELKRLPLKHTAKRHIRPVAGGAPVIACYHCWEVLQLPVDFLLFKKRYHQLMCNGCKNVMRFSVLKGSHIVPYLPDASAPPPSEVDVRQNMEHDYGEGSSHISSGRSYEPIEDRKMKSILTMPQNRRKAATSSEIEEVANSPLHQLMGYSSISQVLKK